VVEMPAKKVWEVEVERRPPPPPPNVLPYILATVALGSLVGIGIEQSKVL